MSIQDSNKQLCRDYFKAFLARDTAWMARITRAAMIFVPCRDGRSHAPDEFATTEAIALGADAVYIGTAALVAMGCHLCQKCYTGKCNWGIATQDRLLTRRLNPDVAVRRLKKYGAQVIKICATGGVFSRGPRAAGYHWRRYPDRLL